MDKYQHKEDCEIVRDHKDYPASAVLFDCDGNEVHRFDEDWSDDQIWTALSFANKAYAHGVAVGGMRKADEVRRAIGALSECAL